MIGLQGCQCWEVWLRNCCQCQSTRWPFFSDNKMLELLVIPSIADEASVIGLSRLASHTIVRNGMSLNHMPTYVSLVEFEGEKKPKANESWSEVRVLPGVNVMPGTSTLAGAQKSTELKGHEISTKMMMMKWRKSGCMLTARTAKATRSGEIHGELRAISRCMD